MVNTNLSKRIFSVIVLIIVLIFAVLIIGCTSLQNDGAADGTADQNTNATDTQTEVSDYPSFISAMKAKEFAATEKESISHDFIPVQGKIVELKQDESLQIFEFETENQVNNITSIISDDGSTFGTTSIFWIAPPHIFQKAKLFVIYLGKDQEILQALQSLLGKQIAGAAIGNSDGDTQTEDPQTDGTINDNVNYENNEIIDEENYCSEESKQATVCIQVYDPVCGWFDPQKIQCIRYPCAQTFSNSCFACMNENVLYYTPGECPTL